MSKEYEHSDGYCEDNKGGNYLRLTHLGNNQFEFSVGLQCVHIIREVGTPSEIAQRIWEMSLAKSQQEAPDGRQND